jgi:hypothetical protein
MQWCCSASRTRPQAGEESVRQLRQRIGFSYHMRAMTEIEAAAYLGRPHAHRRSSGARNSQAAAALHMASDGVPRLLNIMANKGAWLHSAAALQVGAHEAWLPRATPGRPQPAPVRATSWAGTRVMARLN